MSGKKESAQQPNVPARSGPTEDDIRKRAYEIYLARDGGPGSELDDWLRAEAELTQVHLFR
ncbi:MAG: DUF2934 domain-containing protein [Candidatus Binataceae bacterium]